MKETFIENIYYQTVTRLDELRAANEAQGFTIGFKYGVQLMMECMPRGTIFKW